MSNKDKIEVICLIVGVFIAAAALNEYKKTNILAYASQCQSIERELCLMEMEKDHLGAIWVVIPDDIKGKKRADMMIDTILAAGGQTESTPKIEWENVSDLEVLLYKPSSFTNNNFKCLRDAYLYAEAVLYLVSDVYMAYQQGLVSDSTFNTYRAYIKDLGGHPIFLHAVWFGHKSGYYSSEFALFLQEELQKEADTKEIIEVIYPELPLPDWSKTITRPKLSILRKNSAGLHENHRARPQ